MVVGTRRADAPGQALFPALQGEVPALPPEVDAVRAAYDAPFAGLGEAAVTGPRQFPLSIPVHDHARGNGDAQARPLRRHLRDRRCPCTSCGASPTTCSPAPGAGSGTTLIPHSTWDAFDDAAHFLQDTHGDRVAEVVLRRAREDR